jgi:hypothetical protein
MNCIFRIPACPIPGLSVLALIARSKKIINAEIAMQRCDSAASLLLIGKYRGYPVK